MTVAVRPRHPRDREWIGRLIGDRWGGDTVVVHGHVFRPQDQPGFVAVEGDRPVGLITYRIDDDGDCEVVTIDSLEEGTGIGTALVDSVAEEARRLGCRRLWLVTTNDNLSALRFYQRRGFELVAVRPGAVERSRDLKPEIPAVGQFGIPIRDELELELELA